eukprot:CAMPEP_0206223052 /NCGR_PEP_ID=MMETSP0047_2-20121206/6284_1 /ASSEMBLY_ACC=CAM_ASM_000192 /TAXON_ID=195065 /ORGANISM="Chroomonas mesostigmatica_cf, Strain CCMP1168" /LENGTH=91 /DNA_ID=CAMNT_0053645911 /DNA_START=195 /DNA_END=470 /DNA_ORIENTATION=-
MRGVCSIDDLLGPLCVAPELPQAGLQDDVRKDDEGNRDSKKEPVQVDEMFVKAVPYPKRGPDPVHHRCVGTIPVPFEHECAQGDEAEGGEL